MNYTNCLFVFLHVEQVRTSYFTNLSNTHSILGKILQCKNTLRLSVCIELESHLCQVLFCITLVLERGSAFITLACV